MYSGSHAPGVRPDRAPQSSNWRHSANLPTQFPFGPFPPTEKGFAANPRTAPTFQMATTVVALDGPAGSGKSTVARILAERLGYVHADSGAMYRTVTLALMDRFGARDTADEFGSAVAQSPLPLSELRCTVVLEGARQSNRIDSEDVGVRIRTPQVTARIKHIADNPSYRDSVNEMLRDFALQTDLVVDGRDIGSVVFPDTPYKFFVTASPSVRAARRMADFGGGGHTGIALAELERDITRRDREDENRPIGALKQAPGAILIDTSGLDVDSVVSALLGHLQIQF